MTGVYNVFRHALRQFSLSSYSLRKQKKTTREKKSIRGVNLEREGVQFESNFVNSKHNYLHSSIQSQFY